jgi:GR25 family glycosyltransferase involved in LPS biosynthesis
MVSLGWLPNYEMNNYEARKGTYKSLDKFKFLPGFIYYGTQGYIIKKEAAKKFTPLLFKPTLNEVVMAIKASDAPYKHLITEYKHIDHILMKILRGCPIYPLLIIEQKDNQSIIGKHRGGTTEDINWKPFFKGSEDERKNYWSY